MMNVKVSLQDEKRIVSAFKAFPEVLTRELMKASQKAGIFGVGEVKYHITAGTEMYKVPILTGAMRRGIHLAEKKPMEVTIRYSNLTPYAAQVHEGGAKFKAPRPFFDITARNSKDKISEFFTQAIDIAIKRTIKR
jgi:hypothetical protein